IRLAGLRSTQRISTRQALLRDGLGPRRGRRVRPDASRASGTVAGKTGRRGSPSQTTFLDPRLDPPRAQANLHRPTHAGALGSASQTHGRLEPFLTSARLLARAARLILRRFLWRCLALDVELGKQLFKSLRERLTEKVVVVRAQSATDRFDRLQVKPNLNRRPIPRGV